MKADYDQLDYLVRLDEQEEHREADFSDTRNHVSVTEYDDKTEYEWTADVSFDELVEAVEPYFPINRRLALVDDDSPFFDAKADHSFMSPDMVYDPVRDYRGEDRWSDYSLIQLNFGDMEIIWDNNTEPYEDPRIRIFEMDPEVDGFEKVFPETVETSDAREIVEEVRELT
jgi:hypothetical protein